MSLEEQLFAVDAMPRGIRVSKISKNIVRCSLSCGFISDELFIFIAIRECLHVGWIWSLRDGVWLFEARLLQNGSDSRVQSVKSTNTDSHTFPEVTGKNPKIKQDLIRGTADFHTVCDFKRA